MIYNGNISGSVLLKVCLHQWLILLICCFLVLLQGIAPLTLNLSKPDPLFKDAFMPLTASKDMPIRAALSNSFGFGGTNASLLFTSPP